MAQWQGQFTGHTHATRVEDAEEALRHAVAAFRAAATREELQLKAKSVRHLAEKLLTARLKLLKARIDLLRPAAAGRDDCGIETLIEREARARAEGVGGILNEFGAPDALEPAG